MSKEKLFEIWCTGDPKIDTTACHLGTGKGINLAEACIDYASKNIYFLNNVDIANMQYKGCALYDSEEAARENTDAYETW